MSKRIRDEVLIAWEHDLGVFEVDHVKDKTPPGIAAPFIVLDAEMEFVCGCETREQADAIARHLSAAIDREWFRSYGGKE